MFTPLAYFVTFRTYGTWLHGDARGSVDSFHNQPGTPLLPGSAGRLAAKQSLLKNAPTQLSVLMRRIVMMTIREVCAYRSWRLFAANIRSTHAHVLLSATCSPEKAMMDLKAWSTRRLREADTFDRATIIWAHHGSTRYVTTSASLSKAFAYVLDGQGENTVDTFWPDAESCPAPLANARGS